MNDYAFFGDEATGCTRKQAYDPGKNQGFSRIPVVFNGYKIRVYRNSPEKDSSGHIPTAPQGRNEKIGEKPGHSQGAYNPFSGGHTINADNCGSG
jgi:hypothetical protein